MSFVNLSMLMQFLQTISIKYRHYIKASPELEKLIDERAINPLYAFYKDSVRFTIRCTKPERKEYIKMFKAVIIGFFVMGLIGFTVKLVHIPINHTIVDDHSRR